MDYSSLNKAQLSFDYLHTNSTTHEFLFGALAELLDNARDASATKMNIFTIKNSSLRGGFILCFLDDGKGMDPDESLDVVTFGKSTKKSDDPFHIGMYGNGLKSGAMRIGNDLMLFTKRNGIKTCLFLSRTFHEEEKLEEIIVPIPSFNVANKPLPTNDQGRQKHETEMSIILKYSPFKTPKEFFCQFQRLEGKSGTLVMIYNLKLLDTGEAELDITTDPFDIILANPNLHEFDSDEGLKPERKSFRAYTTILYLDPRMRIYIQNKKVCTRRLACTLYKPMLYKYSSLRFRTRSELQAKTAVNEASIADQKAKEAESKVKDLENRTRLSAMTSEQKATFYKAQRIAAELREQAQMKQLLAENKTKSLKEPKTLNLIFGLNLDKRNHDGVFVYNCSRLIKMYERVGPQSEGGALCCGVVGIVDVPYVVLEPTHNKQDFADAKEYRLLLKAMGEHMLQYWKDLGLDEIGAVKFWESFGYISPGYKDAPSSDVTYVRKRAMQISATLQCDLCLKWRMIPSNFNKIGKDFPDHWSCSMNPDKLHNRCSVPEESLKIPESSLKKDIKSQEQRQKELEEEIQKKVDVLTKLKKVRVINSVRDVNLVLNKDSDSCGGSGDAGRLKSLPKSADQNAKGSLPSAQTPAVSQVTRTLGTGGSADSSKGMCPTTQTTDNKSKTAHKPATRRIIQRPSESSEDENTPPCSEKLAPKKSGKTQAIKLEEQVSDDAAVPPKKKKSSELIGDQETPLERSAAPSKPVEAGRRHKSGPGSLKSEGFVEENEAQPTAVTENGLVVESGVSIQFPPHQNGLEPLAGRDARPGDTQGQDHRAVLDVEAPTSSTSTSADINQLTDDIANGYRACLRYFLPPEWVMDKDSITSMTMRDLIDFPLDSFFSHYERGIRRLVSNFQTEASTRRRECEETKTKLKSVRKLVVKLLKSMNEDLDMDVEEPDDQVDDLLAACVRQATSS